MTRAARLPTVSVRIPVGDASQVAPTRTEVVQLAQHAGFRGASVDTIALVATELAQNLYRHAVGGELLLHTSAPGQGDAVSLTMIAVDRGPGVERFERCLVDGYTTAGTMGTGLGAVRRLATFFDAVSEPGSGTVVVAGFAEQPPGGPARSAEPFDVGTIGFPIEGEQVNGDGWGAVRRGSRVVVMLADGLGHGPAAAEASTAGVAELEQAAGLDPALAVQRISDRIARTRGAAVSVASLDLDVARAGGAMSSAGLGNVSILVAGPDGSSRRVATSHGTAGVRRSSRLSEQRTVFPAHGVLVLHSDGLTSRWTLDGRAALLRHSSTAIAAALWRDHARGTDDTLVVVVKARSGTES